MFISISVQTSGWGDVNPSDSYSTKHDQCNKVQGNMDSKKKKVHFIFQVFFVSFLFTSLPAFSLTFLYFLFRSP